MHERAEYVFGANDDEHGNVWITFERREKDLSIFKNKVVMLQMRKGISIKQADELAESLRDMVESVSYTDLPIRQYALRAPHPG